MKARGTSWSEPPVRPAALALRTKVIADRAGSGDCKGVAIAGGTPPEARTATFGDTNNESAIGRPHNRNRGLNGSRQAKGDHDAKQSSNLHAFLPLDPRHAACCVGVKVHFHARLRNQSKPNLCAPASRKPPCQRRFLSLEQRLGRAESQSFVRAGATSADKTPSADLIAARCRTTLT